MSPRRRRRVGRWVLRLLILVTVAWLGWEAWTWPDVGSLARRAPATTAFIERWRAGQRQAGRDDRVDRRWVPYGDGAERQGGGPGRRGHQLLLPPRVRQWRDAQGADTGARGSRAATRRLHHHPAARQEPL